MPRKPSQPNFEKALRDLETLVERMEQGEQTLEQALKDFERGIALVRTCQQGLAEAEQKVDMLLQRDGEPQLETFHEPDAP
jgi:exodeoxyribonuclease VII small subunit